MKKCDIEAQAVLDYLTEDNVNIVLDSIGYTDDYKQNRDGLLLNTSLCHNGSHYNLQFNEDSKLFFCYSECSRAYTIFQLVQRRFNIDYPDAIEYVAELLGYEHDDTKERSDIYDTLKHIKSVTKRTKVIKEEKVNKVLPESILDQFYFQPYSIWTDEGISPEVQNIFEVGISLDDKRVILPHRHWETGQLIGIVGRTLRSNWQELDIGKWMPIYHFYHNLNIFGLWNNKKHVIEQKEIILVESEKTPMLAKSMGINNVCAISGHSSFSNEQIKILSNLALKGVKVVIAMDKDVKMKYVKSMAKKISLIAPTYIIDTNCKKLGDKDSPFDKGIDVFNSLYQKREQVGYF